MTMTSTIETAQAERADVHQHHGSAMGTKLHVLVVGDANLVDLAVDRIEQLESRWSRFIPGSEIDRCNSTRGIPVDVSADTRLLIRHAVAGWELTCGAYDPTVLDTLIASGYDRSYDQIVETGLALTSPPDELLQPAPGCDGIVIDDDIGTITLPEGVGFDPGGIGKGLAADLIVEVLMKAGAQGAMVNLGGDLRVAGEAPSAGGWVVEISEPAVQSDPIGLAVMVDGGLATSTTRRRVWTTDGQPRHHVIDPRLGRPVESNAQLATVISAKAWWSEVLATQLLLSSPDQWANVTGDAASLVIDAEGMVHTYGSMKDHLR